MKIIHRDDIEVDLNTGHDSTWYVCREVTKGSMNYIEQYKNSYGLNPVFIRLDRIWQKIITIFDYETSGKQILELGCGANGKHVESDYFHHKYQPWLGRFLHATKNKTGLDYVGVDIGDLSGEKFSHVQMNLLEKNCLTNAFSENQFDLVIAYMLFNSPELENQANNVVEKKDASYETALKLKKNLAPQLETIIKPEGAFLWQGGDKRLFEN
jgi:hypothetical protein